ncbi:acyl-CoA synthetase [Micromonospora sp. WMMD710]|uniref:acyl-CoA synthetase n=1 Tax=Micromonospora sp. WMMD710 TaxID=3016085 RepID=UPI002417950C|nr:acyl-CoA synthetase [Micromonospora sp. WMMD710]MDG4759106.1 acyl-CoA synthetase [Micromonospora sp. WMMD710]
MNSVLDPTAMEQVPLSARDLPPSTYALLERTAKSYGDRTALVLLSGIDDAPRTVSYEQLLRRVTGTANALSRIGVGRGDAVALLGPNSGELLTAILAAEAVGIAQPINPVLAPDAIAAMLQLARTKVLIAAGPEISVPLWNLAVHLGERFGLDAVLALRPEGQHGERPHLDDAAVTVGYLEDHAAEESADALAAAPAAPGDIAAYFHTGGTTGTPRLAAHTHAGQVFVAWSGAASIDGLDATVLGGLPMFHVNAVMVTVLAPMVTGARVVWPGPLGYRDPALYPAFWRLIERYRVTTMSAVPTVYARLAQVPIGGADISSLTFAISGAAAMPSTVRRAFEDHTSVAICDGYGLTEATCASARIMPGHPREGSVGLRMPYQQIRAVRPGDGSPLPPGETGVITISGPAVFPGYVTTGPDGDIVVDPLGKVVDGWLDTGDLGHVDADGYVFITGRLKDVIIRGGHNIDPALVEEAVLSHPAVAAASAVGQPDRHAGEVPVCYVTLRPGAQASEDELTRWAAGRVAERAVAPKAVHVLDELPVTAVGKDFKPALRADAVRRVLLAEIPGVEVVVAIEDGVPVAEVSAGTDEADRIREVLGRYSFRSRLRST